MHTTQDGNKQPFENVSREQTVVITGQVYTCSSCPFVQLQ